MLQLAICDDDKEAVRIHREIAEACLRECGSAGEIALYTDSGNLLCDILEDRFFFDLILLDIEMPGKSGMELAEKIKPVLPNVKIIFITSHIEYAIDAYELAIFRYVPKDDLAGRLPAAVRDAVRLILLEDGRAYTIRTNSRLEKSRIKRFITLSAMAKTPASPPQAESRGCAKACSRFMRSWGRRNSFILTGDVSST